MSRGSINHWPPQWLMIFLPWRKKISWKGQNQRYKWWLNSVSFMGSDQHWFFSSNHYLKTVSKWMSLYKSPLYDLFWPIFCHMYVHLSQNWGSDNHFEVLNRSIFCLLQKLWHKTQIFPFLFILQFCTKTRFCVFVFCVITFVPIKIYNR